MKRLACILVALLSPVPLAAQYPGWQHSGTIAILTTPEGADLPASASVEGFPLLVRLDGEWFDFRQAKPKGEDIRFSEAGRPLAHQVEAWDPAEGSAAVWVRIPTIRGNERREIRIHWGKADAASESSGAAVFDRSNGYLGVWHMSGPVRDETGTLESKDVGTTTASGLIGPARRLAGGQGIFCGDGIVGYPTGDAPHTSEAWFRPERPNTTVLAWGNEEARGKVVMQYRSPPHVNMDCYFSGANVAGRTRIPMDRWVHVVHTYRSGESRIYVNGILDATSTTASAPLSIKSPARLWIGGWYHNYDFVGDIDEVRVSGVERSPDWVRLEHENQKPLQTLAGHVVQPGSEFSVTPARATVREGGSARFSAEAGGARKVYWILGSDGRETVVATDRFSYTFDAGRVTGDRTATLRFRAIYAEEAKTAEIPITIQEAVPDPEFALNAPAAWDGRTTIEVAPRIANLEAMREKGAGELRWSWSVSDIAVIQETPPGRLVLHRAQKSGRMVVTATADNGGQPTTRTATIVVTEPDRDAWVARTPAKDETPEDGQFYARDGRDEGTLVYNGTAGADVDSVFLDVFADGRRYKRETARPAADGSYAFAVKLAPGLVKYEVKLGSVRGNTETVLRTVTDLVCGDAYLIDGQSNAVATDWGPGDFPETSEWIRTYGSMGGDPKSAGWGHAVRRAPEDRLTVGYWAFDLAKLLVERHKIPICIINGAVGGTRVDQHQRNPEDPEDLATIYGRLLWRVRRAGLTHGIRGVIWHQGENDQGADGPTGGWGWETYRQYFIELAAAWKQDYPNVQHYYLFQIWPKACSMGSGGSDDRLREVQRTLPRAFSNLAILSTLGIRPPGGCHYPAAGYAEFARLLCPLLERDHHGAAVTAPITPPDLVRAWYTSERRDEIAMEFDQDVVWTEALVSEFRLDGEPGKVASGSASGKVVTLKLTAPSPARTITYIDGDSWSQERLLWGANGIAALTFCEVPIGIGRSAGPSGEVGE